MRLLMSGDIHIGRASSLGPAASHTTDAAALASSAWERVVELAIRERVDLVCLSGDIADEDNRFWEAVGPLERGVRRLADRGIRTLAVAGNHDHEVLGRLARQLPATDFRLLGEGGDWERYTVADRDGRPQLHIDGWSFPAPHVRVCPLVKHPAVPASDAPVLGMVHGDLDAPTSMYAPLPLPRLQALPASAWLLGHVHAPRLVEPSAAGSGPWVLYPGSPQALDAGEPGGHGAWTVDVRNGRIETPRFHHLSTVWYEVCCVDLTDADDVGGVRARVLETIRSRADAISREASPDLQVISLRLNLVGGTAATTEIGVALAGILDGPALECSGGLVVEVTRYDNNTLPAIDLLAQARSATAPGALARLLLRLDPIDGCDAISTLPTDADLQQLIEETRSAMRRVMQQSAFDDLAAGDEHSVDEISDARVRDCLRTQARALLSQLLHPAHVTASPHFG